MTLFAHRNAEIIAIWDVGDAFVWQPVVDLGTFESLAAPIAARLTVFSMSLWESFEDPSGPHHYGSDARSRVEAGLSMTLPAPDATYRIMAYDHVANALLRLREVVRDLPDTLRDAVLGEVEVELGAVEDAALGQLSDRARQAVVLSPPWAPPNQVASAEHLIRAEEYDLLVTDVLATAACVAATHWLAAAVHMLYQRHGFDVDELFEIADDIEAIDTKTGPWIVHELDTGTTADAAVAELIRGSRKFRVGGPPIDHLRPAPDLRERLVEAIHACYLVYDAYYEYRDLPDLSDAERQRRIERDYWRAVVATYDAGEWRT